MTCAELEHVLPEIVDGPRSAEQEAHLHSCAVCASVVADLNLISQHAGALQGSEEPSPRVWNSISSTVREWESEMDLISSEARQLQASEEPSPRVWNSIAATVHEWQAEMDLIAHEARQLQASEDPSPRVWRAIQANVEQWQSEMSLVSDQARELQESETPSPTVWNSLEIALRQEGLIRKQQPDPLVTAGTRRPWVWAWMAPVAATLIIAATMVYERGDAPAGFNVATGRRPVVPVVVSDDQQMLETVSSRAPAMRASYENNLRNVNAYIHDAEQTVKNDPTDEEAQESLVNAYEQKSMLYEMALDRSLP
jgi:hypothetical protein